MREATVREFATQEDNDAIEQCPRLRNIWGVKAIIGTLSLPLEESSVFDICIMGITILRIVHTMIFPRAADDNLLEKLDSPRI
ncbi:hypothetical protein N7448_011426 [Penicillium atrosanguineum]|nr:hypothetical protein N7526_011459 [Penicillium atrosanguineum]KAJ5117794.1 hypothetical protein N7448_011426 [Penicillium atrosanguineum]